MGSVMATLSLEARRRFSRPSFLADCRHSTAHYHRSDLNCLSNSTQDSNQSPSSLKYIAVLRELLNKDTNIDMKLDMCDANIQKHQFSNLPEY